VMGLLNCLAFACMYRFLARETTDKLLAFLGLTTILYFGYVAGRVATQDLFLQYHPLRTLFPALSLVVVQRFSRTPTPRLGAVLFALGAVALLWNPDTGTTVLAAGALLVVYDALLRRRPREIPARLLLGVAVAAAVIATFTLFLRLRFGAFPDYAQLFLYPQVFYLHGAGMLPMPRFGLWVPILLVYAAGLLRSLAALIDGEDTPRVRILFFLSVLGLGLFTYYQGRSALGNLVAAGYPAIMIVVLIADELRRVSVPRTRSADRLLSVTLLALLLYSVPALAVAAPDWVRAIAEKIHVTTSGEEDEMLSDARFLERFVRRGQEVAIMSYNSGFFHVMTQTSSPLGIPGDSEILYRTDYEKQEEYVLKKRGTFVIDKTSISESVIEALHRTNPVSYENPAGNLIVFPVPASASRPGGR
jgi:hypothetical protein